MTHQAVPAYYYRDHPTRRLSWTLPVAVLLVLLGVIMLGKVIGLSTRHKAAIKPSMKPLNAQIYELPTSRGSAPSRAQHAPTQASNKAGSQSVPMGHDERRAHTQPESGSVSPTLPKLKKIPSKTPDIARQKSRPKQQPAHKLDWAALNKQINAAVNQEASQEAPSLSVAEEEALANKRDPHTLVAHYYIASVLQKLQRIGDMNYPTNLTGTTVIKLVVGKNGALIGLTLLQSSGDPRLDRKAQEIARESAPFAPFPDKLGHQTSHIELICYMSFIGYRQIYAN